MKFSPLKLLLPTLAALSTSQHLRAPLSQVLPIDPMGIRLAPESIRNIKQKKHILKQKC